MIPYNLLSQNKHFQCPPLNLFKNVYLLSKHPFFFRLRNPALNKLQQHFQETTSLLKVLNFRTAWPV